MSQVNVSQIIAGTNINISPPSGTGNVTINSTSSTIAKCASFGRIFNTPLQATGPSVPLASVASISFDAGPTPTDGFVIFNVNVGNFDSANVCNASIGVTNSLTSGFLLSVSNVTMNPVNTQQVTIMYPLVNISGPQTIYGIATQGLFNQPENSQQIAFNPSLSVVWGGNASIQQG
jgi:hypothetical protein